MAELQLSVIAPCFNEEPNIAELTRRVLAVFDRATMAGELILVDDGSSDGTRQAIDEAAAQHPGRVVSCFHLRNRGVAEAWRTGLGVAQAPTVAIIDADLQYQPEDLLRLYRDLFEHSVDVVQGWRSQVGRERGTRYSISRGLNSILNAAFDMRLQDNKSGFVMCAREVMQDLLTYRGSYYYWQSFIMVAAHAKGYSYKQIETLFENRRAGTSFLDGSTYSAVMRTWLDLAVAVWEYRFEDNAPDVSEQFLRRHAVMDRSHKRPLKSRLRWRSYLSTFNQTHWTITRNVERHYESLRKTQWLTPSQLRDLQNEKLRRLVRHAYRNVPYYRERMRDSGLRPEDISTQEDLRKLPFLTKADVRKHLYFDILSENHDKRDVQRITTSGSTGEPFVCFADRGQLEFRWAATLRSQEWAGYVFGDPCVRLWHQTIGMSRRQALQERIDATIANRLFIPVFEMSDERLDDIVRQIADHKPVLIDGYAEAFDLLSRYVVNSRGGLPIHPRAVMSSAQTLPDSSRRLIEEAFGCRVFDKYGAREFSGIAYECAQHTGHHIVGEGFIVEILRDGEPVKPGEVGEVIITDLNNYCLPFIRYRIGDLATATDPDFLCPCGRGLPLIGKIEGRVQSIIQGTGGQYLPGTFFAHVIREYDHAIKKFQIEQVSRDRIIFRIVKAGRYSEDALQQVLEVIHQYLGRDMTIEVEFVDAVAMVPTGKHVATLSRLDVDFQQSAPQRRGD